MSTFCCCCLVAKLCPTLWDPVDCSPPGSSVHGILQARLLEWVAISFSRDLPHLGIKPALLKSPKLAGGFFTISAICQEGPSKKKKKNGYNQKYKWGQGVVSPERPVWEIWVSEPQESAWPWRNRRKLEIKPHAEWFNQWCPHKKALLQIMDIKTWGRASLVVQWLRIHLAMLGSPVWSLVHEDPTCCGAVKLAHHNCWAWALEHSSHNHWAHVEQLLRTTCPRACAPQEKPP